MHWIEWPPADGFALLESLFNSGPAWIILGAGFCVAVFLELAVWAIFQIGRDRGREVQRLVDAEIQRRERRRGEGSSVGRHCTLSTSSEWESPTPTGWKVNTHDH